MPILSGSALPVQNAFLHLHFFLRKLHYYTRTTLINLSKAGLFHVLIQRRIFSNRNSAGMSLNNHNGEPSSSIGMALSLTNRKILI